MGMMRRVRRGLGGAGLVGGCGGCLVGQGGAMILGFDAVGWEFVEEGGVRGETW